MQFAQVSWRENSVVTLEKKAATCQICVDVAGMRQNGFGDEMPAKTTQAPVLAAVEEMPGLRVVVSNLIEDQKLGERSEEFELMGDRLALNSFTSIRMNYL